jgi:hypothetical protein
MRGLLNLFTKEQELRGHRTGIFVASAEPDVVAKALPIMQERFPEVLFTFLVSRAYAELFPSMAGVWGSAEVLWIDQIKVNPIRRLIALRRRRFDLCVMLWSGRPTFRITKVAAFLLKARRVIVYDENGDSVVLDRANWKYMVSRATSLVRQWRPPRPFYPFGFLYLLGRTLWLTARGRVLARKAPLERRA